MKMTLNEYINQVNPIRFPKVILKEEEYLVIAKSSTGEMISIPKLDEAMKNWFYYFRYFESKLLWTMDDNGNPKKLSCFETENTSIQ